MPHQYNWYREVLLLLAAVLVTVGTVLSKDDTIDPRIWGIGYWQRLAEQGLVPVASETYAPPAEFTGSKIIINGIEVTDTPDVAITGSSTTTQSENSVFVNPLNTDKALNSNNSTNRPVTVLYGTSHFQTMDGGVTWPGSVTAPVGSNYGDPAAAIGLNGRYYISYITTAFGIAVARSTNEGTSWCASTVSSSSSLDKEHLWVDNAAGSPNEGNLYCSWTTFGSPYGAIQIKRSTDDGVTWVDLQTNISAGTAAGSFNQGVNVQTGPAGQVYATWAVNDAFPADEIDLGFSKSTNAGVSFTTASRITNGIGGSGNIKGIRNQYPGTFNHRVNSFPTTCVDISGGAHNGRIYVFWTNSGVPGVNTGTDRDIYMMTSDNEGTTWSLPTKVNQDPSGLGKVHYEPWATCDPVTGDVSVIYYTNRNVTGFVREVYVSHTSDGGAMWEDFKVSDVSFTLAPIPGLAAGYCGDYIGISARDNKVYPAWTDTRTGWALTYSSPFTYGAVGGGIPCSDVSRMIASCKPNGRIKATVRMTSTAHDLETVEVTVDGTDPYVGTIAGDRAVIVTSTSYGAGSHTVALTDPAGCTGIPPVMVTCAADGITLDDDEPALQKAAPVETPATTSLKGNYPNPFNPSTTIHYSLSADTYVTLKVYNTLGQEVATLVDEFQPAGFRQVEWNGKNQSGAQVGSGVYIYRMKAGNLVESHKMILSK